MLTPATNTQPGPSACVGRAFGTPTPTSAQSAVGSAHAVMAFAPLTRPISGTWSVAAMNLPNPALNTCRSERRLTMVDGAPKDARNRSYPVPPNRTTK